MLTEIITIGNEVLSGVTLDTNAGYLVHTMSSVGAVVTRITTVGDDVREIAAVLRDAMGRAQTIVVTGGIGPTPDDVTAEAAARALGKPLVIHENFLESVRKRFDRAHLTFTTSDERFALLPEGAEPLHNPVGIAGFKLETDTHTLFFLPGVPREVHEILEQSIIPFLTEQARSEGLITSVIYGRVFGRTESGVKELLEGMTGDFELTYLPAFPELRLRLVIRGNDEQDVRDRHVDCEAELRRRLGTFLYAVGDETMETVLGKLLKERGLTLSIAESCTGGLIGHRITEVPGSSDYFMRGLVVYSNDAKEELLGVPQEILARYGAVSKETATLMAREVRTRSKTAIGLSTTGIAGPTGGTSEKPVGRVYIALDAPDYEEVKEFDFFGDRHQIKLMTSQVALDRVRRYILEKSV
jgi:nicotinamide-nucleotide amidase